MLESLPETPGFQEDAPQELEGESQSCCQKDLGLDQDLHLPGGAAVELKQVDVFEYLSS